ncbi:UNVERIFIED_ORG: hypothetical protein M2438_005186 [Methylobacterium sp. SuP10 SLI 274]|uniref:hypothetical protein n=1 Tax=Methylorubrum extorquens TaxID=408 RepID=UPI00209FCAC7|nr:hypothetical protein [Methylorubrum extorquens]MDF9866431.1 hypothetical protein [Methylorubrum pseudosasae]MDH6639940.1 hypothetical protein [Methylobacterium sp. SuP10 SLI 274]MDH6669308.1 hypothetical protein [Methylorubrum zatmanii]MCP1561927.1 hypothetical protein [Methylorubrum extorquens]MDF9794728.1 hypothetical protein [Methylorubrum extorquens]
MNTKPSFGFGKLAEIQPTTPEPAPTNARDVDRAAEKLGFPSREVPTRRKRRTTVDEPTDQLNLRATITDINRFVEWCEAERMSYREGFGRLVSKIGQSDSQ